jgi:hypothetical protein
VGNELPRFTAGRRKAKTKHHVIDPSLEKDEKVGACNAILAFGHDKESSELFLAESVDPAGALFFP